MLSNEIQKEVLAESYQGQMSYALPFGRDNYIKPFKRLAFIPYLGAKMKDTQVQLSRSDCSSNQQLILLRSRFTNCR